MNFEFWPNTKGKILNFDPVKITNFPPFHLVFFANVARLRSQYVPNLLGHPVYHVSIIMESDIGFCSPALTTTLSYGGSPRARMRESDWWEVALKSPLELLMLMILPTYTYKWLTYNLAFYFLLCFTSREENKESIGGVSTETEQMCPIFFKVWKVDTPLSPLFAHCDKIEFLRPKYFSP